MQCIPLHVRLVGLSHADISINKHFTCHHCMYHALDRILPPKLDRSSIQVSRIIPLSRAMEKQTTFLLFLPWHLLYTCVLYLLHQVSLWTLSVPLLSKCFQSLPSVCDWLKRPEGLHPCLGLGCPQSFCPDFFLKWSC